MAAPWLPRCEFEAKGITQSGAPDGGYVAGLSVLRFGRPPQGASSVHVHDLRRQKKHGRNPNLALPGPKFVPEVLWGHRGGA